MDEHRDRSSEAPRAADFIDGLPKAELHLHIEGSLEPEMAFALAARNDIALPYDSVEALRGAYDFRALQDFLDLYYQGMAVPLTERDFHDLTWAYLERAGGQGVLHAEIFFDPQAHSDRGVPFAAVVNGISAALEAAHERLGMSTRLILCFLRDQSAEAAMATLEAALPYRDRIVAVGLDSAERDHPPREFVEVFARARAEGFLTVAHAGEEGPPDYIRQALDLLEVRRIDHGNSALEDAELVRRLAAARIPLTVCPLSNVKLGVVPALSAHPLRAMMERGLFVTVNSDDPAYFGGYIGDNYRAVRDALGLTREELARLARNSIEAAFLERPRKETLLGRLEDYLAAS